MSIGKISDFDIATGNWSAYTERMEMYFLANKIADEVKLPTLIAVMGEPAYELLATLASPEKPSSLCYKKAVDLLQTRLQPKPSTLAERYRFRQRRQLTEESIANYVADLKKLTRYCDFGSQLEENIRDQFVCGLRSETIRQRLYAEENLNYKKAITLAVALEAAERDASAVENNKLSCKETEVNAVNVEQCLSCGKYHRATECRYKQFQCSLCHKIGHLRRMCSQNQNSSMDQQIGAKRVDPRTSTMVAQRGRTSHRGARMRPSIGGASRGFTRRQGGSVAGSNRAAYWVREPDDEAETEGEEDLDEPMYQMSLAKYKPVRMSLLVQNKSLEMEVDTGSALSCISAATYKELFTDLTLHSCKLKLKFYDGSVVRPLGYISTNVKYKKVKKTLDLYVINNGSTNLLGRQWLSELDIEIPKCGVIVNSLKEHSDNIDSIENMISRHKNLFDGTLGKYTGGSVNLCVREGAVPVYCAARPLPYALRARVDAELDAMLAAGVIELVARSEWATPLVIARKADGGIRLCADYKLEPGELALWNREYELKNKVSEAELKIESAQHELKKLVDKVSTKLNHRNVAQQNLQNMQRRVWLLQQVVKEMKFKKNKLRERKAFANSLCLIDENVDVEGKLDKYIAAWNRTNNQHVCAPSSNTLLVPNPVASSSAMSANGDICDAEEQMSWLANCRGDSLWLQLYKRRAGLFNSLGNETQRPNVVSKNLVKPQTVLAYTSAMHCTLALETMRNRILVKHTRKRLVASICDLNSQLTSNECELFVLKCERACATARVYTLRGLLADMAARRGAFHAGPVNVGPVNVGPVNVGPDNVGDTGPSVRKQIASLDKDIESKRDKLKRLLTSMVTTDKKIENARDCLLSIFSRFQRDQPVQAVDRYRGQIESPWESLTNLHQFYEMKSEARINKLRHSLDLDVSDNYLYNSFPDTDHLTFVDELKIYLKKFNLEKNKMLVLENGQKMWVFETLQAASTRFLSKIQDINLTNNLICPARSLSYNIETIIANVQNKHRLQSYLEKIESSAINPNITFDLKDQEGEITDKIKKQLYDNILNLPKINKRMDLGYEEVKFWFENEMKQYISQRRLVNGKSYDDYEFSYKDSNFAWL